MKKVLVGVCMLALAAMACGSAFALHDPVAEGQCPNPGIPVQFGYCELPIFPQGAGQDTHAAVTTWPTTYDFCGMLDDAACSINGVTALGIDLGDLGAFIPLLQCVNADINGPVDLQAAIPVSPNGVPDGQFELQVIGEALTNPANPYHAEALAKFQGNFQNLKNLIADALNSQGYWGFATALPELIGSLGGSLAAYSELGDAQTIAAMNAMLDLLAGIGVTPPAGGITEITQSVPALNMDTGDADHDGYSNREEYNYFKSQGPAVTIAAIFNAAQTPPITVPRVLVLGAVGTRAVGTPLELTAVAVNCSAADYQWIKDGAPIASATASSYMIASLALTDAGKYKCQIHTTAKAPGDLVESQAVEVKVSAEPLPIAGGLGLALLAGACALGGVGSIRRRK